MNQEPIFILGAHKSGTSLLRSLFDGHKNLFVIPIESHFFEHNGYWIDYGIRRQYPKMLTEKQVIHNYLEWIKKSNITPGKYSDSDTRGYWNVKLFEKNIRKKNGYNNIKTSIENYIESMYVSLYNKKLNENIRIVEKSVENAEFVSDLKVIYPKAKFVHILRNPYSNLVSIRKFKSNGGYPFLKNIMDTLYNSYYYLEKNKRIFRNDYLIIKYEELVSNSKEVINKIINFVEISKDEIIFSPTVQGDIWEGNSTSDKKFKEISSSRLHDWKESILPIEVILVNKMFKYVIDKYEYEFISSPKYLLPSKKENLKSYIGNRLLIRYFI